MGVQDAYWGKRRIIIGISSFSLTKSESARFKCETGCMETYTIDSFSGIDPISLHHFR